MAAYTIKKKNFGPKSTVFNSKASNINSDDFNVKAVILEEKDFTVDNVKKIIEEKASALLLIYTNENFTPGRKWNLAYEYLSTNNSINKK